MNDDFTTEALHYLLNELDPKRRAQFEEQLARDPVAASAFKSCAEALSGFALSRAPATSVSAAEQREILESILAATAQPTPPAAPRPFPWRRYLWPMAAAVLLGINLLQLLDPLGETPVVSEEGVRTARLPSRASAPQEQPSVSPAVQLSSAEPVVPIPSPLTVVPRATLSSGASLEDLETLRIKYANLQQAHEALGEEYQQAISRMAQLGFTHENISRLTAMELVSAEAYERGERQGLPNLARGILTTPGIVVPDPAHATSPLSPAGTKSGENAPLTLSAEQSRLMLADANPAPGPIGTMLITNPLDTASGDFRGLVHSAVGGSFVGISPDQAAPQSSSPPLAHPDGTGSNASDPYAWSVIDETRREGYLNLYNLPSVAAEQSLQLWVKPPGSESYEWVGEVPREFYGQSGTISYQLPSATNSLALVADIVITLEPKNGAAPTAPTGKIVLRGP